VADGGEAAQRERRYARRRRIEAGLKQVNLLIEVADARAPEATRSAVLSAGRFATRARVVALVRADLADASSTRRWLAQLGQGAVALDARSGRGVETLVAVVRRARPQGEVRAMVVGLPNLGKSSLVNRLSGRAHAAAGNRPGVTVGEQWVRARPWLRLLDEPGVLPAGPDPLLAALGCVPDGEYEPVDAFAALWSFGPARVALSERFPGVEVGDDVASALEASARAVGAIASGGRPDSRRAAAQVLALFRDGRLGRLTLQTPRAAEGA
jgi:ribosome biogenesis GTPase A